ncbi:MAG TPA: NAD(P)/FAD-dependent oxidoreductase [Clostridiales bacterium]|jgi:thioredoxin reductase (NADPH)|nr:NAD(P)/FAD-dependent oxidoreductase [Clostridiales bacterium]
MSKVIVIGKGPAGVSCAIYTARAGIDTTIIGNDIGSLGKAEMIENYYGFAEPISGAELSAKGIAQAERLGVRIISEEVVGMGYDGAFSVKTQSGEYRADSVVIATGSPRKTPKIKGIEEFEGLGVSYCAVCDGFFYRGKSVCVLGSGEYALNEARELIPIAHQVTILTNGEELAGRAPEGVEVIEKLVSELRGGDRLDGVLFKDGSEINADGVFIAYGTAGSADLARKLGVFTEGNKILVNEEMETNIPGLFAAGDCTGGMMQVAKAVYEGARAGMAAIKYLRGGK